MLNVTVPAAATGLPSAKSPPSSYLTPSLSYDRAAIMRRAWVCARAELKRQLQWGYEATLKACFADALRKTWNVAKGFRATEVWRRERNAEFAAAAPVKRQLLALREDRACAVMIDSTRRMLVEVAAIDAQIAVLQAAA